MRNESRIVKVESSRFEINPNLLCDLLLRNYNNLNINFSKYSLRKEI